jgi:hypothetical protein
VLVSERAFGKKRARDGRGASPRSSGIYFYVLDAGKQRMTRKLVLLK